jgi:hypothetical protein
MTSNLWGNVFSTVFTLLTVSIMRSNSDKNRVMMNGFYSILSKSCQFAHELCELFFPKVVWYSRMMLLDWFLEKIVKVSKINKNLHPDDSNHLEDVCLFEINKLDHFMMLWVIDESELWSQFAVLNYNDFLFFICD